MIQNAGASGITTTEAEEGTLEEVEAHTAEDGAEAVEGMDHEGRADAILTQARFTIW